MSISTTHVIILATTCLHQLLELRDYLLPASITSIILTSPVMHFLTSIQTKYHITHLFIAVLNYFIINQHAICSKRKSEVLIILILYRTRILNYLLTNIPVHQRLTTEEINLQIMTRTTISNQKIYRLLANLKGHKCPLSVVLTLRSKAVLTVQITSMRHMKT